VTPSGSSFAGNAFQSESPEDASAKRRAAEIPAAGRFELVDEALERRTVVEIAAYDVEGNAEKRADPGLAARAGDALLHSDERRQESADPLHVPDAVELAHG
jgi:hypothetical protein